MADGTLLPLPPGHVAPRGKPLVYGVRPEHVKIEQDGLPVRVMVTEPTGSETQLVARLGDQEVTLLFHQRLDVSPGDDLSVKIDMSAVHLFDKETGRRL